jgi:predicted dinucleotide-binding enzyme
MATTIGILGTGRMGVRLAQMFARTGQRVILGSRDIDRAHRIATGLALETLTAGSYEAAAGADVILPAMFLRDGLLETLEPLRHYFDNKV